MAGRRRRRQNGTSSGLLNNPVLIGAATGAVLWYIFDEILDDHIERLLGKKKNRNKKKGRGGQKGKLVRNRMGIIVPMDEYDNPIVGIYDTELEGAYTYETEEEEEKREKRIQERWEREDKNPTCWPGNDNYPGCLHD